MTWQKCVEVAGEATLFEGAQVEITTANEVAGTVMVMADSNQVAQHKEVMADSSTNSRQNRNPASFVSRPTNGDVRTAQQMERDAVLVANSTILKVVLYAESETSEVWTEMVIMRTKMT